MASNLKKKKNNETIGQTAEAAFCSLCNIKCNISQERIDENYKQKIENIIKTHNILEKLPTPIKESCGFKNNSVDFKLENGETLSLKTLKYNNGKICPQKVGQPTLKSWDRQWDTSWEGKLEHNSKRFEFIKNNIYVYLNRMLEGIFCCDYLIIIKNCSNTPTIDYYNKQNLKEKLNFFSKQVISYTRIEYEEKWNPKKKKFSEMNTTIRMVIDSKPITIGEFQFHKSSRQVLKFRFMNSFLKYIF
jgi:hypothetical protein